MDNGGTTETMAISYKASNHPMIWVSLSLSAEHHNMNNRR